MRFIPAIGLLCALGLTGCVDYLERRQTIALEAGDGSPPLRAIIAQHADEVRQQAQAATERWAKGAPLGPLDGVPVAVKDELDQRGYPTTVGTAFLGFYPHALDDYVGTTLHLAAIAGPPQSFADHASVAATLRIVP